MDTIHSMLVLMKQITQRETQTLEQQLVIWRLTASQVLQKNFSSNSEINEFQHNMQYTANNIVMRVSNTMSWNLRQSVFCLPLCLRSIVYFYRKVCTHIYTHAYAWSIFFFCVFCCTPLRLVQ